MQAAKKQAGNNWDKIKSKFPKEIREEEKGYYHVAFAKPRLVGMETVISVNTQLYNKESWVKVKDSFGKTKTANVFIYHDPTQPIEELGAEKVAEVKNEPKGEEVESGEAEEVKEEKGAQTAKEYRKELKVKAKSLGYEGAMTVKNEILEDFIKNAEENGEGEE